MKPIEFTDHARFKMTVLERHRVIVSEAKIVEIIKNPTRITKGYASRKIAQRALDENYVLRVVYEETEEKIIVVTLYPGRKSRYEKDSL
jgi:hypothetical protein